MVGLATVPSWGVVHSRTVSSAHPQRDLIHQLEEQAHAYEESARKIWEAIAVLRGGGQVSKKWQANRKEPGHHVGSMPSYIIPFLKERYPESFSTKEIYEGMKEMGWVPAVGTKDPQASVSTALLRQCQLGHVRRAERGRYQAVLTDEEKREREQANNVARLPSRGEVADTP